MAGADPPLAVPCAPFYALPAIRRSGLETAIHQPGSSVESCANHCSGSAALVVALPPCFPPAVVWGGGILARTAQVGSKPWRYPCTCVKWGASLLRIDAPSAAESWPWALVAAPPSEPLRVGGCKGGGELHLACIVHQSTKHARKPTSTPMHTTASVQTAASCVRRLFSWRSLLADHFAGWLLGRHFALGHCGVSYFAALREGAST